MLWVTSFFGNLLLISPQPRDLKNVLTVPTIDDPLFPTNGVSITPANQHVFKEHHATLTLTSSQIKNETRSEAILTGAFNLAIPKELQATICDATGIKSLEEATGKKCGGKGPVAQQTSSEAFQLKPQYASESVNLSAFNALGFNGFSKAIPLNAFFLPSSSTDPTAHIQIPVTLSLVSQGEAYPDDSYWGDNLVSISLPSPLYVYQAPGNFEFYLPIDLKVLVSAGIGNMAIDIVQERNLPDWLADLTILAKRSFPFRSLIYLTTIFIILGFLIFISHSLFASKKEVEPLQSMFLNAFLAFLTVVAIRQIMVPSDLQGFLTRLDLILAVAATLLLGLIFTKYAVEIW